MDHSDGWMNHGGMRVWAVVGMAIIVLLIAVVGERFRKWALRSGPSRTSALAKSRMI